MEKRDEREKEKKEGRNIALMTRSRMQMQDKIDKRKPSNPLNPVLVSYELCDMDDEEEERGRRRR